MTYVSTAPVAAGTDELLQLKKLEELRGKILKHLTERRSVKFILNEIALGVHIVDGVYNERSAAQQVRRVGATKKRIFIRKESVFVIVH